MSIILKKLLEGASALPYSDSTISMLEEAALSYIDLTRVYEIVEELSLCYLGGKISHTYRQHISLKMAESSSTIILPENVLRRIAFFIVWKIIMDTDNVTELTQAISTTVFMNFLVIKKTDFYSIPNPVEVKSIYKHHLSSLIHTKGASPTGSADDLAERIFNDDFDISKLTASDVSSLRELAQEASLYYVEKFISRIQRENEKDEFLTTYNIVKYIVDTIKSPLSPCDIVYYLKQGLGSKVTKRKKLKNIITVLPKYSEDGVFSNSSIILRLLNNDVVPEGHHLLEIHFSVYEFGIYLFYELLVERLIEQTEI